jgi:Holliday junction resolvase RusA-like endonuclease
MKIVFTILGQCCSMKNSRQIVTMGGKPSLIKSKVARDYERSALMQIPPAAKQMLTCPVRVTMRLYYASQRPDLDGALLLDILAARYKRTKGKLIRVAPGEYVEGESERVLISNGVYENDRLCREIHLYHGIDRERPRAEIEIEPLQMQQEAIPLVIFADEKDPF